MHAPAFRFIKQHGRLADGAWAQACEMGTLDDILEAQLDRLAGTGC